MLRTTQRAILLIAFCLLTSAATAYAECAWVLWWRSDETWKVMAAYENLGECDSKARAQMTRTADLLRKMKEVEEKTLGKAFPETQVTLHCLPDAVDPREAKGK